MLLVVLATFSKHDFTEHSAAWRSAKHRYEIRRLSLSLVVRAEKLVHLLRKNSPAGLVGVIEKFLD